MTIAHLHKLLGEMVKSGQGRAAVCIDKSKCSHPLESDGVCIIPVTKAEVQTHEMLDENGSWKELANGSVATRTALVIEAEC